MITGTVLLAATIDARPDSAAFYALAATTAAVWMAGSVASGPLPLGRRGGLSDGRREFAVPAVVGVVLFGLFVASDLVARHVPGVSGALDDILSHADIGPLVPLLLVALVSGIGEEAFFRGALYSAIGGRRPVAWSTLAYAAVTVVTGNVALVVAAAALGSVTALERRSARGILAPAVTHVVWSALMLAAFPR